MLTHDVCVCVCGGGYAWARARGGICQVRVSRAITRMHDAVVATLDAEDGDVDVELHDEALATPVRATAVPGRAALTRRALVELVGRMHLPATLREVALDRLVEGHVPWAYIKNIVRGLATGPRAERGGRAGGWSGGRAWVRVARRD